MKPLRRLGVKLEQQLAPQPQVRLLLLLLLVRLSALVETASLRAPAENERTESLEDTLGGLCASCWTSSIWAPAGGTEGSEG